MKSRQISPTHDYYNKLYKHNIKCITCVLLIGLIYDRLTDVKRRALDELSIGAKLSSAVRDLFGSGHLCLNTTIKLVSFSKNNSSFTMHNNNYHLAKNKTYGLM